MLTPAPLQRSRELSGREEVKGRPVSTVAIRRSHESHLARRAFLAPSNCSSVSVPGSQIRESLQIRQGFGRGIGRRANTIRQHFHSSLGGFKASTRVWSSFTLERKLIPF